MGGRTISDVTIYDVSATDNKSIKLGVDYEFQKNIIVLAYASYTDSQFIGTSRTDDYPAASISVRYLMNEYSSLNLSYHYSQRSRLNAPFIDFSDDTINLQLGPSCIEGEIGCSTIPVRFGL